MVVYVTNFQQQYLGNGVYGFLETFTNFGKKCQKLDEKDDRKVDSLGHVLAVVEIGG